MPLPKLGWSFGVLAFVGAAVLSVVVNRWSEEPFQRIRVANAVTDASAESSATLDRRDFIGRATAPSWSTEAARSTPLGPVGEPVDPGSSQHRAVVQTAGSWSSDSPPSDLQEVQQASLASGDETTISQPGKPRWESLSRNAPPQSLPKTYPRATNAWHQAEQTQPVPLPAAGETSDGVGPRPRGAEILDRAASPGETETAAVDAAWPPVINSNLPRREMSGLQERASRAADSLVSTGDAALAAPGRVGHGSLPLGAERGLVEPLPEPGTFAVSDPSRMRSIPSGAGPANPAHPAYTLAGRTEPRALPEDSNDPVGDLNESAGLRSSVQRHNVHVTRADESLWSICLAHYGRGSYFRAFYEHNRQRIGRPDQLEANLRLQVPTTAELRQWYPTLCPAP